MSSLRPTQYVDAVPVMPLPSHPISAGLALAISIVGTIVLSVALTHLVAIVR